jgi:siderophore synthetase component
MHDHLHPDHWEVANRMLVRKAISEFSHERILEPAPAGGIAYTLTSDDGATTYWFDADRMMLDHWVIDAESISRIRSGESEPIDALDFILDFAGTLGITPALLPVYLEEISSTLAGSAYKLAKPQPTADELARAPFQTIETSMTEGHPCFVANNGRLGFGSGDYHAYAPETGSPVRLCWIAVHKRRAGVAVSSSVSYAELLDAELGSETLNRFALRITATGRDPDDYHLMPVHPWQWSHKIAITFAAEIARRDIVYLGRGTDDYQPQQSIRTFFNLTSPRNCYVKTSLSILNMGFMRGLSAAYMEKTPAINDWVHRLVADDVVLNETGFSILREIATVGYRNDYYERATERRSPYRKMLAALWRESPVPSLREGEELSTMAALLHVDASGRSLAAALVRCSGLSATDWLRRYLDAYLVPLLHCFYAYELMFMPHGENLILVLRDGVPVRVIMKDIAEEIVVSGSRVTLPEDVRRVHAEMADDVKLLAIFTDVFDCFFRFLAPLLAAEGLLSVDEFWATVADSVHDYQRRNPELADRFAEFDIFADEFRLSCLNRLQLRNNQQMVDLTDVAGSLLFAGTLANPLAEYRSQPLQTPLQTARM